MHQKITDKDRPSEWELDEWVAHAWNRGGKAMDTKSILFAMERGKKRHNGQIIAGRYDKRPFDMV